MKLLFSTFLVIAVTFGMDSLWANPSLKGKELAQKVYDRPDGENASSLVKMILQSKTGNPRVRTLYIYGQEQKNDTNVSLIRFTEPENVNNTGLLTIDRPGKDTDQWIYLPALKKSRRISSSRRGGRFVGSDYFYEDLRDRRVEKDHHKYLGRVKHNGADVLKLESVPVDKTNSVYSRRVSYIHPETLIPLKVEFYKGSGKVPIKTLMVQKIENKQGIWTVMESSMLDHGSGHKTVLSTQKIKYNRNLPANLFTEASLTDPGKEKAFRKF